MTTRGNPEKNAVWYASCNKPFFLLTQEIFNYTRLSDERNKGSCSPFLWGENVYFVTSFFASLDMKFEEI